MRAVATESAFAAEERPCPLRFLGAARRQFPQENPQYWKFSPRMGLAWTPIEKTVVRVGAGIFYTTFVGVNAAATDFGNGGFISNFLFLGQPNPLPNTPPVGGSWDNLQRL